MASNPTDLSDLPGLLKPVFGELQFLLVEEAILQNMFPFSAGNVVGKYFEEPVEVQTSWGVTYAGTSGDTVDLVDSLPSKTQSAQVTPAMTIVRDQVSYGAFDRSSKSGKKAFMDVGAYKGKSLTMQMRRVLEISALCGQDGFGVVDAYNGSTEVCTITAASFRPGILAILENARLDFFQSDNTTHRNSTDNTAGQTVSAVDHDARTFTLSAAPTADPVAGDIIYLHGANASTSVWNEMVGLRKQASLTTGTVFNIAKQTYSTWRGNVVTGVGAVSAGAILNLISRAINRGFQGKAVVLMSPKAWNVLNSKDIGIQAFDSSYSVAKAELGMDKIMISGQGVKAECVPHSYMADGEIMVIPKDYVKRVGSEYAGLKVGGGERDITFDIPGSTLQFLQPVLNKSCVEMQVRSDQQIFCSRPAWMVLGTGVTY